MRSDFSPNWYSSTGSPIRLCVSVQVVNSTDRQVVLVVKNTTNNLSLLYCLICIGLSYLLLVSLHGD